MMNTNEPKSQLQNRNNISNKQRHINAFKTPDGIQIKANPLDWTHNDIFDKDDSMREEVKLANIRRNSGINAYNKHQRNVDKLSNFRQKLAQNMTQNIDLNSDFPVENQSSFKARLKSTMTKINFNK